MRRIVSDEEYRETAADNSEMARKIADKLDRGEGLEGYEAAVAAAILRAWANTPKKPKRKRGQQQRMDPGTAEMMIAVKLAGGATWAQAVATTAENVGVTVEAVRIKMDGRKERAKELAATLAANL
ncbi:MAG TPA: hypothetical protein PKZ76_07205, partial [Xanthomonadaceae bacterium]|nr:hypothetical protein [Xanthomonadaceae bacterium]